MFRLKQDIIVVASLIDKVANLAGIARTCEIFAIDTLVFADVQVVKTDMFQSISVSSENWIDLIGV